MQTKIQQVGTLGWQDFIDKVRAVYKSNIVGLDDDIEKKQVRLILDNDTKIIASYRELRNQHIYLYDIIEEVK